MHVLILVQNLPVPFDRRVWQEAQALKEARVRRARGVPAYHGVPPPPRGH